MAIRNQKEKLTLRLELDGGIVDGKQKFVNRSFSQIKPSSEDSALHGTAIALSELQSRDLVNVKKIEVTNIWDD